MWKTAFSTKGKKRIVVVSVNTTFDTIVDENLAVVNKPLVSPSTIHGQWLNCMKKKNVPISDIDKGINDSLSLQGIVPAKILNHDIKDRGKIECYEKGTIAQYEYENTVFYLMALSEFDENNNAQSTGVKIGVYQFTNPSGLDKTGDSYLMATDASGIALNEDVDAVAKKSVLKQNYLEASNVNVATEMVNLITAQRAYELCSKAITTSDTMMEQANNLKR